MNNPKFKIMNLDASYEAINAVMANLIAQGQLKSLEETNTDKGHTKLYKISDPAIELLEIKMPSKVTKNHIVGAYVVKAETQTEFSKFEKLLLTAKTSDINTTGGNSESYGLGSYDGGCNNRPGFGGGSL